MGSKEAHPSAPERSALTGEKFPFDLWGIKISQLPGIRSWLRAWGSPGLKGMLKSL